MNFKMSIWVYVFAVALVVLGEDWDKVCEKRTCKALAEANRPQTGIDQCEDYYFVVCGGNQTSSKERSSLIASQKEALNMLMTQIYMNITRDYLDKPVYRASEIDAAVFFDSCVQAYVKNTDRETLHSVRDFFDSVGLDLFGTVELSRSFDFLTILLRVSLIYGIQTPLMHIDVLEGNDRPTFYLRQSLREITSQNRANYGQSYVKFFNDTKTDPSFPTLRKISQILKSYDINLPSEVIHRIASSYETINRTLISYTWVNSTLYSSVEGIINRTGYPLKEMLNDALGVVTFYNSSPVDVNIEYLKAFIEISCVKENEQIFSDYLTVFLLETLGMYAGSSVMRTVCSYVDNPLCRRDTVNDSHVNSTCAQMTADMFPMTHRALLTRTLYSDYTKLFWNYLESLIRITIGLRIQNIPNMPADEIGLFLRFIGHIERFFPGYAPRLDHYGATEHSTDIGSLYFDNVVNIMRSKQLDREFHLNWPAVKDFASNETADPAANTALRRYGLIPSSVVFVYPLYAEAEKAYLSFGPLAFFYANHLIGSLFLIAKRGVFTSGNFTKSYFESGQHCIKNLAYYGNGIYDDRTSELALADAWAWSTAYAAFEHHISHVEKIDTNNTAYVDKWFYNNIAHSFCESQVDKDKLGKPFSANGDRFYLTLADLRIFRDFYKCDQSVTGSIYHSGYCNI